MINKLKSFFRKGEPQFPLYFDLFAKLYVIAPEIYYWIVPFPGQVDRYVLTHFKHSDFIKYNGLELVIIDKSLMTYHRLPGAKPNGTGHVSRGQHDIMLNSMHDSIPHYFSINKMNHPDIQINSISAKPDEIKKYTYLPRRMLDYDRFVPELIEIILSGLEWHYRNKQSHGISQQKLEKLLSNTIKLPLDPRIHMLVNRILNTHAI